MPPVVGWLPLGAAALWLGGHVLATMLLPGPGPLRERLCLGPTIALAAAFALVELLGALRCAADGAGGAGRVPGFRRGGDATGRVGGCEARRGGARAAWPAALRGPWALAAAAGIVAVGLASLAALRLESWGWDALAYHLPPVHDALQTGRVREVPTHVAYARVPAGGRAGVHAVAAVAAGREVGRPRAAAVRARGCGRAGDSGAAGRGASRTRGRLDAGLVGHAGGDAAARARASTWPTRRWPCSRWCS